MNPGFFRIPFISEPRDQMMFVCQPQGFPLKCKQRRILFIVKVQRKTLASTSWMYITAKMRQMRRCCFSSMAGHGEVEIEHCTEHWAIVTREPGLSLWCQAIGWRRNTRILLKLRTLPLLL